MSKLTCDVCGAEDISVNFGDAYTVICASCSGTERANRVIKDNLADRVGTSHLSTQGSSQGDFSGPTSWGQAPEDGNTFSQVPRVNKPPWGSIQKASGYQLARSIAKFVIVVGWLSVVLGLLAFVMGLANNHGYWGVIGLVSIWQGIVIVLVAYGLIGIFDIADGTSKTVSRLEGIYQFLSDQYAVRVKGAEGSE